MLKRAIEPYLQDYLRSDNHKVLFIWGPRRSGKTTLLKEISKQIGEPIFNFDLLSDKQKFLPDRASLSKIASEHKVILIDEVQNYPESSLALKILFDEFSSKVIATGSSELRQTSTDFDSLAGRFAEASCLPLSVDEIYQNYPPKIHNEDQFLSDLSEHAMTYGLYPEVFLEKDENKKIDLLQNLLDTYVLKDVIDIYNLKNIKLAKDILTKVALQLGSEVSVREIANSLQANVATVSSYLEIFIKNYILIPVVSFKTNLRKAVSENRKLYFYDLGIRNILIKDFRETSLRPDAGGVFENFIVSEIEKRKRNLKSHTNLYFYREYGGKEVDLVLETYQKEYTCLEIKLKKEKANHIFPLPHKLISLNRSNYFDKISSSML